MRVRRHREWCRSARCSVHHHHHLSTINNFNCGIHSHAALMTTRTTKMENVMFRWCNVYVAPENTKWLWVFWVRASEREHVISLAVCLQQTLPTQQWCKTFCQNFISILHRRQKLRSNLSSFFVFFFSLLSFLAASCCEMKSGNAFVILFGSRLIGLRHGIQHYSVSPVKGRKRHTAQTDTTDGYYKFEIYIFLSLLLQCVVMCVCVRGGLHGAPENRQNESEWVSPSTS